jgi:hypothetical protein
MIINCPNNLFEASMEASLEYKFVSYIQKWLRRRTVGRHAIIAGSYALHAFMGASGESEYTNMHCFVPNDIDIYVNAQMEMIIGMITSFILMHDGSAVRNFEIKEGYSNNSARIDAIVDFRLLSADQCIKVQLISWNQESTFYSAYDLAHAVLKGFDISICRVAMTSSKKLSQYYFYDSEDAHDISLHRFKLTMKPRDNTGVVFNRILKYTSRGFCLYQLLFQDGIISGCFSITETIHEDE